jgi:enoyl-CoA hydratase/carnithine racemase
VIVTGTGESFINAWDITKVQGAQETETGWKQDVYALGGLLHYEGRRLIQSQLDIEVPMIAAVNGPVSIHSEQALLCDIVLASETATFRDACHFMAGLIPGDGVSIAYEESVGLNRSRYFMLTGLELSAQKALDWGLVAEIHPPDKLMDRARELAEMIHERPPLVRRLTRQVLVQNIKKRMLEEVGYTLAVEMLALTTHLASGLAPMDPRMAGR